jgi:hypothetical protein
MHVIPEISSLFYLCMYGGGLFTLKSLKNSTYLIDIIYIFQNSLHPYSDNNYNIALYLVN